MPTKSEQIFHITVNNRRTTFSLDNYLSELLAIKLNHEPHSKEAHTAIRQYLTETLNNSPSFDPLLPISKQARRYAIDAVVEPTLLKRHTNWILKE